MIDKPLNQLNAFFKLADERNLSGKDQLFYLHLFYAFNKAHWTETVTLKNKDLLSAMRLYDSKGKPAAASTLKAIKSRLKLKGFIDFKAGTDKAATEYSLPALYPIESSCAVVPATNVINFKINPANRECIVSETVLKAWYECTGEDKPPLDTLKKLHEMENFKGMDFVAKAIRDVLHTFNKVTIKLLEGRAYGKFKSEQKGVMQNGRTSKVYGGSANKASTGEPDWVDKCPN